jgi:arylsulfatase
LIDLVPTILDLAGADYPKTYKGNDILPIDGLSLRPAFSGNPLNRGKPFFVEHENNAFVRDGKWKLVGRGVSATNGVVPSRWELYDIEKDRTEINNLATSHPDKTKEMAGQWAVWAKRAQVYPKNNKASEAKALPNPPQVKGRAFTITAEVEHGKPKGVVLSHGGVNFGYALYFNKGKPAFCMRNGGELTELVAKKKVQGRVTLSASLDDKTLTLSVGGKEVAQCESPGLFRGQPAIGLYLGEDFKDSVGQYKVPNKFNGKIHSHKATVHAR